MSEREEQAPGASPVAMVERVARAIEQEFGPIYGHRLLGEFGARHQDAVSCARAAIAAMREPTEAMMDAGISAVPVPGMDIQAIRDRNVLISMTEYAGYPAMIDEALKP